MELKITKGEWVVNSKLSIQVNPNDPINTSTIAQVMGNDEEAEANSKLIAAAPNLLEFIIRMANESNFIDEQDKQEAIQLINKATK